jgi:hypothetical protein
MANFILKNQKILMGHIHITNRANAVALSQAVAALNDTTYGQDTASNMPGLRSIACSVSGLYDPAPEYDTALSSELGFAGRPFTLADSTTVTSLAYFFNSMISEYSPIQNSVGELAGFNAGAVATKTTSGNADLVRGQVGYWTENFTTSANGTAVNLGAATTSQKIGAAVHLFGVPSSTFTFAATIESAASSAASSSQWTARFTFSTFTTKGSTFQSSTGNITDTWWRFTHATVSSSQSTGLSAVGVFGIY